MKVCMETKKAEAIARMRKLGIFEETIKQFEKENLVSISEPPFGVFFWVNDDELAELRKFEQEHDALVYVIVRAFTTFGQMDAYIYVSDDIEEWDDDRDRLDEMTPFCYVRNVDFPDLSEFGYIGIKQTVAAGLQRIS